MYLASKALISLFTIFLGGELTNAFVSRIYRDPYTALSTKQYIHLGKPIDAVQTMYCCMSRLASYDWVKVKPAIDITNDTIIQVTIDDSMNVILFVSKDRKCFAVEDRASSSGTSFRFAKLMGNGHVECPTTRSVYDLETGRAVSFPMLSPCGHDLGQLKVCDTSRLAKALAGEVSPLNVLPCRINSGYIELCLDH